MNFRKPIITFPISLMFKRVEDIMLHPYCKGIGHITHHIARQFPAVRQIEAGSAVKNKLNCRRHVDIITVTLVHIGLTEELHIKVHIGLLIAFIRYGQCKITE